MSVQAPKSARSTPALIASTNEAFCPSLRGLVQSELPDDADAVLEIVIDGLDDESVGIAMCEGIRAACADGKEEGILEITASNFGGKLGKYHFHLHELLC